MFTPWMTAGSLAAALYLINQPVDYLSRKLRRLRPQGGHGKRHHMAAAFGHRLRLVERPAENRRQGAVVGKEEIRQRSEEHTSELQSLMRISYAVFCLKKKKEQ